MKTIWNVWVLILFLSFPLSVHAQESGLILYPSLQDISIEEEFSVAIVGKDLLNIAGGDIIIVYDGEKLQQISKQYLLPQEKILDIQKENKNILEMQDEENICKFLFGLRKNTELISEEEKTIAVIGFKAIKAGEAFVRLSEKSQWVQEEDSAGEIAYVYELPRLLENDLSISIAEKREPDPKENPDEKDEPGGKDDSDKKGNSDSQDAAKKSGKRKNKKYLPPALPSNSTNFIRNHPYPLDAFLYFWRRLMFIFFV